MPALETRGATGSPQYRPPNAFRPDYLSIRPAALLTRQAGAPEEKYEKNPQTPDPRASSLARSEGLEPPTYKFVACCSIQLSYDRTLAPHDAATAHTTAQRSSSLPNGRGLRRERDSNPRYALTAYNGLANRRLQPLGHLSTIARIVFVHRASRSRSPAGTPPAESARAPKSPRRPLRARRSVLQGHTSTNPLGDVGGSGAS